MLRSITTAPAAPKSNLQVNDPGLMHQHVNDVRDLEWVSLPIYFTEFGMFQQTSSFGSHLGKRQRLILPKRLLQTDVPLQCVGQLQMGWKGGDRSACVRRCHLDRNDELAGCKRNLRTALKRERLKSEAEVILSESRRRLHIVRVEPVTAMLDVPVDRLLLGHFELERFVLHVRGQLHPAKGIRLPDLVELDGIAATAHLLTALPAVDGTANPPDLGVGLLLEDPPLFPN
jgi:hypothetical protein